MRILKRKPNKLAFKIVSSFKSNQKDILKKSTINLDDHEDILDLNNDVDEIEDDEKEVNKRTKCLIIANGR